VEIFIVRLAAGLFIAAFDGWPKFLQGIAHILQNATWPLRNSLEMLGPAFPALSAFAPMITFPLGGLFVAAEFLMRSASLDLWVRSCCCLWESATGQGQPDGDAVYVA
jgi:hypothetical protein